MKCLVCGTDWADDFAICPKDGNDLRSPTPTVERSVPEPDDMMAPAYGLPPMAPEPVASAPTPKQPELMVSAYGMVPMPPPEPYAGPMLAPAYGIPPVTGKPRPLLALAIVALVMIGAIIAVVLSR